MDEKREPDAHPTTFADLRRGLVEAAAKASGEEARKSAAGRLVGKEQAEKTEEKKPEEAKPEK